MTRVYKNEKAKMGNHMFAITTVAANVWSPGRCNKNTTQYCWGTTNSLMHNLLCLMGEVTRGHKKTENIQTRCKTLLLIFKKNAVSKFSKKSEDQLSIMEEH